MIKGGRLHEGRRACCGSGSFPFWGVHQVDGVALVAGLGSWMSLMAEDQEIFIMEPLLDDVLGQG